MLCIPLLKHLPSLPVVHPHVEAAGPRVLHDDKIDPLPNFPDAADRVKLEVVLARQKVVGDVPVSCRLPAWN